MAVFWPVNHLASKNLGQLSPSGVARLIDYQWLGIKVGRRVHLCRVSGDPI